MGSMLRRGAISGEPQMNALGFAGSARAQLMLKACQAGTDCVDIVTIGDSNVGFTETGGIYSYGYHTAFDKRYDSYANEYASPLFDAMLGTAGDSGYSGGIFGTGFTPAWPADNLAGNASGPGPVRGLIAADAASDIEADLVVGHLGLDVANLPKPFAYSWQGLIVTAGTTFQTGASKDAIIIGTGSNIYANGAAMQYRVLHARTTVSGGQFKLGWWAASTGATFASGFTSTSHTSVDVPSAATFDLTAPSVAFRVGFDGLGQGTSHRMTGPAPILAHSVIRTTVKGFSFTNFMWDSGAPTTRIADRSEQMDKLLDYKLRELRERQVAAGGTGNLIVMVFTGINGSENSTTYTAQAQRIVDRFNARWLAGGGDASKIAFCFVPTHPVTTSINNWLSDRSAIVSAANSWAAGVPGVCVFDIAQHYTGAAISSNGWYSTGGNAHLKDAGYDAMAVKFFNGMMA